MGRSHAEGAIISAYQHFSVTGSQCSLQASIAPAAIVNGRSQTDGTMWVSTDSLRKRHDSQEQARPRRCEEKRRQGWAGGGACSPAGNVFPPASDIWPGGLLPSGSSCGLSTESLRRNMTERSLSSSSSSSSSWPSAVSWSGGATHSQGTTQGNAMPMLAARFSQLGAALAVSLKHSVLVKWLQFFWSRL